MSAPLELPRVWSECTRTNNLTSEDDAITDARQTLRWWAEFFVWRYPDGTYQWTAPADVQDGNMERHPPMGDAVLVSSHKGGTRKPGRLR